MADGLSIGAAMSETTIFECPSCKETIDATADSCRFCGAKVDHEAARKGAETMARINRACSDASFMKSTAMAIVVFFVLRFVPFLGMIGYIGFPVLLVAVPIWSLIWLSKYRGIETDDAEFLKARSTVKRIGIIVTAVLAVVVALNILALQLIHSRL
ncbi:MAG: hypothetical protein WDM87_12040 [Terracidiphilus sp.]